MSSVAKHFDEISGYYQVYKRRYKYYYDNLKKLLSELIPKNKAVLEIGCATGNLLVFLKPKIGYGIDISPEMIKIAKRKYSKSKNLNFSTKKVLDFKDYNLDYIFLSDVIEHLQNPKKMFADISEIMTKRTKLVITMANPVWEPLLMIWEKLGWKMREGPHKRIKYRQIEKMLIKIGLSIEKHSYKLLLPVNLPIISKFVNKYLERPLIKFAFIEYFVVVKSTKL